MRFWDGSQWTGEVSAPPSQGVSAKAVVTVVVAALVIIGAVLNLSSVSLLTGSDKVWTGAALIVVAAVLCFFPKRLALWVTIAVAILAAGAIANGIYVENQLQQKRDELNQIFEP